MQSFSSLLVSEFRQGPGKSGISQRLPAHPDCCRADQERQTQLAGTRQPTNQRGEAKYLAVYGGQDGVLGNAEAPMLNTKVNVAILLRSVCVNDTQHLGHSRWADPT